MKYNREAFGTVVPVPALAWPAVAISYFVTDSSLSLARNINTKCSFVLNYH